MTADLADLGELPDGPERLERVERFRRRHGEDLSPHRINDAAYLVHVAVTAIVQNASQWWVPVHRAKSALADDENRRRATLVDWMMKHTMLLAPLRRALGKSTHVRSELVELDHRFGKLREEDIQAVLNEVTPSRRGSGAVGIVRGAAKLAELAGIERRRETDTDESVVKRFRTAYQKEFGVPFGKVLKRALEVKVSLGSDLPCSTKKRRPRRTSE
jgi:hypothetical protein